MTETEPIKASAYCYFFNLRRFSFPYREALQNFCAFFDEVCCATIKDEDDSAALLRELTTELPNLRVIETDISLSDNRFDGKLKTAALRATTHPIKVIADGDERFVLTQKSRWQERYWHLLAEPEIDGLLVPVLDLWGAPDKIRADSDIGQKFRIHKGTVVSRGVLPEAERFGGLFDTSRSDSTEPLLANGNLARFASITPRTALFANFARLLRDQLYVVHEGYLDLEGRAKINGEFWKQKWEERSGREEKVVTDIRDLRKVPTVDHGLPIR